ncbi:MAG: thioredoxin domain-containing protein [Gemmatimonadota bacterium]
MIVTLAAVLVAGLAVRRELKPSKRRSVSPSPAPQYLRGWERLSTGGMWLGDSTAPVRIIEFGDFECPYCRKLSTELKAVRDRYGAMVAINWVHFPIPTHRFAMPAARAALCAGDQQVFAAFHDAVFSKQDSLGLKSWVSYAVDAGVRDTLQFQACVTRADPHPSISRGLNLGDSLGVDGTPTIVVNGWRYSVTPYDSMTGIVEKALKQMGVL